MKNHIKNYERLYGFYDSGWGTFSKKYIKLLESIREFQNLQNKHILDLACGTGELAVELARMGNSVCGIDKSSHMIKLARTKIDKSLELNFIEADICDFDLKRSFDLILCTFDSINYLVGQEQIRDFFYKLLLCFKRGRIIVI